MNETELATLILTSVLGQDCIKDVGTVTKEQCAEWDSVAHVNLIAALESELDVFMSVEEAEQLNSFDSITRFIKQSNGQ